ncbi:MAG: patatin-like phospholipase family protein, partial [Silvanigrellaceae bacterium]|nr:patatin-like phospholipase family protein [Silvanigrellaceae bacterium]
RSIGVTGLVNIIDFLGLRSSIDEIWTSSGGAFVGYLFGKGFNSEQLDKMAYESYHKNLSSVTFNVKNAFSMLLNRAKKGFTYDFGFGDIRAQLTIFLDKYKDEVSFASQIPTYMIATNPHKRTPQAFMLNNAENPFHYPFLSSASPLDSFHASCSIPYVIRPADIQGETYWDGGLSEETPIAAPTLKWLLDGKKTTSTPKKLKILMIQASPRVSNETRNAKLFQIFPVKEVLELIDCYLDSTSHVLQETISQIPNVEVLKITLGFDKPVFLKAKDYAYILQKGKKNIVQQLLKLSLELEQKQHDTELHRKDNANHPLKNVS